MKKMKTALITSTIITSAILASTPLFAQTTTTTTTETATSTQQAAPYGDNPNIFKVLTQTNN